MDEPFPAYDALGNGTDDHLANGSDDHLANGYTEAPIPEEPNSDQEADSLLQFPEYGDGEEEPLFMPPLYIQRYCYVEDVIESHAELLGLKSLADLGCAELKFLVRAKNGNLFERIIGLDMDEFLVSYVGVQ